MENNPFECLLLFTNIPRDAKIVISHKGKKLSSVFEGQWVGVPELLDIQKKIDEAEDKTDIRLIKNWEITVIITKIEKDPIEFLEFDYYSLEKALANKEYGQMLQNSLRSIWMHTYKDLLMLSYSS
jgi:hypothetical protein